MSITAVAAGLTRVHVVAIGIALAAAGTGGWLVLRPEALRTPDRIAGLELQTDGLYGAAQQRLAAAADAERRLSKTVSAVYGRPGAELPTLGVAAGVIGVGHGDEIVGSLLNALRTTGVTIDTAAAYPAGSDDGFECGGVTARVLGGGPLAATYCTWWDERTVGAVVVYGLADEESRNLALQTRKAVAP